MSKEFNILITSVGRRSYLVEYFKQALAGEGYVCVANSSEDSPAFAVADKTVVTPLIYDEEYIPFLLQYCKDNQIKAIISLFDVDLPVLAKNKEKFSQIGTTVIVSDIDILDICNDKWKTYKFLTDNGFNAPKTYICLEKAKAAIASGELCFPLIVKPRWGMGSIAVYDAENLLELDVFYNKVKTNIMKTYLKFESEHSLDESVLIQEKLGGYEYGLDVINDLDTNHITTIVKRKYAMRSGETDCAVTVNDKSLKKLGQTLAVKLRHIANLDVDVFKNDGTNYVLEMNARFGGGYPFSHMAGVDLPAAIIKWLKNEPVEREILREEIGVMSHKDIKLTFLRNTYICEIKKLSETLHLIEKFEKMLNPTFTERGIDIDVYASKLYKFGRVFVEYNQNDEAVGMVGGYINDREGKNAYVSILAVSDEARGMHIGEKLMCFMEKEAEKEKMNSVRLEVRCDNESAIKFYEFLGYKIIGRASENSYYMEKNIGVQDE